MTPQDHKNAINAAMMRCVRYRDTPSSGEAVEAHDAAVQALVRDYEIAITLGEYLAARLEKAASDLGKAQRIIEIRTAVNKVLESEVHELTAQMEAVGAGGVDGRRITGEKS